MEDQYYLTAADVKALYPSLDRDLIQKALNEALLSCSDFTEQNQRTLVELCMYYLRNALIQFQGKYYKQDKGIPTGENNSVSLANISLHYVIQRIPEIVTCTNVFQRYIDDIIYITSNKEFSETIKGLLKNRFSEFGLQLTFREIETTMKGASLEFLDVLHEVNPKAPRGFITTDFTKPTAINHTFIDGRSHHPPHVFRGIVFGEGKRLRRLNETDEGYRSSIQRLKDKCLRSHFNKQMVMETTSSISGWKRDFDKKKTKKEGKRITWATQFKNIICLNRKEKELAPRAAVTYCRPPTLGSQITNYKFIAKEERVIQHGSHPCNRCGLCGKHGGLQNMVMETDKITLNNGKEIRIKGSINCKDHGIYAAQCNQCRAYYVGQTKKSFSTRWNTHRHNWRKMGRVNAKLQQIEDKNNSWKDQNALYLHYVKNHSDKLHAEMSISDAYIIAFIEKPDFKHLDTRENHWISKINATINIAKTFMPKHK